MGQETGVSEVTNLSGAQLSQLNLMIGGYLQEKTTLEARIKVIDKTVADIAGAYLAGLGVTQTMNVDLATGKLTPVPDAPVVPQTESVKLGG